jgi:hypothetical protein
VQTWRPVPGYEGLYEVSTEGSIRSLYGATVRPLKTQVNPRHGYRYAHLRKDGVRKAFRVARLVLAAFVGVCPDGHEAAHEDGDRKNDRLSNLAWKTRSANMSDQRRHGTAHRKLEPRHVREIRDLYRAGAGSQRELGIRFGVSKTMVRHIVNERNWVGV